MAEIKTLRKRERIIMFINEYYFGNSSWITLMRIIGGPLLILIGVQMYGVPERFEIAYGGFCVIYGVYFTLKPAIWILSRLDAFKSVEIEIDVNQDKLMIKDSISQSEVDLGKIEKLMKRRNYFAIQIAKFNKVYLPLGLLTTDQIRILDSKVTK